MKLNKSKECKKMNIYERLRKCQNNIIKSKKEGYYGYHLLAKILDEVDLEFTDLNENKKDIVIMRITDSLERIYSSERILGSMI